MNNKTVLIAEDNEDTLEFLKFALELKGYKTLEAKDGLEAVQIATHKPLDLIIMDLTLPYLDGFQTTRSIRKLIGFERTPVIMISGYGSENEKAEAKASGCTRYLTKPVDVDNLYLMLENLLAGTTVTNDTENVPVINAP